MEHTNKKKKQLKITKAQKTIQAKRLRRSRRTRLKVQGSSQKPRLSVMRSNIYIYAQLIDDMKGNTLVAAFGLLKEAGSVGEALGKKAFDRNVKTVVFDKGAYAYHGRVKELADGARKGGLSF